MKKYTKPESALVALNLTENIAASDGGRKEAHFTSEWNSDPSATYVSNSNILWSVFVPMADTQPGIRVYMWMKETLGDIAFDATVASCLKR